MRKSIKVLHLKLGLLFCFLIGLHTVQSQDIGNQYFNLLEQPKTTDMLLETVVKSVTQERDTTHPAVQIVIQSSEKQPTATVTEPVEKVKIKNASVYYESDLKMIQATENKMKPAKLGGIEDSPIHLDIGTILFYKTRKDNFGKMQILKYTNWYDPEFDLNRYNLYIRWTTYDSGGGVLGTNEYEFLGGTSQGDGLFDLDSKSVFGYDFKWYVTATDKLLFLTPRKETKFYLVKPTELAAIVADKKRNTPIIYNESNKVVPKTTPKEIVKPPSKLPVKIVKGMSAALIILLIVRLVS